MMHLNTHFQHKRDVLNRIVMRLSFVVFILLGYSTLINSQTNVPVCRDGVIRLADFLTDPVYMGAGE